MVKIQNFVIWMETAIAEDVVTIFCTSNFELDTPFPEKINKNVIGLMKDE